MTVLSRRALIGSAAAVAGSSPFARARAQTPTIRIGVLNDQSGPYRDISGPVSVACARQAVEEFGRTSRTSPPPSPASGSTPGAWTW